MSHNLTVKSIAVTDIEDAAGWYDAERIGLGDEFRAAVDAVFDRIASKPAAYAIVEPPFRRSLVHRFPFAVYYTIERDRVFVHAVVHTARHPDTWRERL